MDLPHSMVRVINLDLVGGTYLLTSLLADEGFVTESFDDFNVAWKRTLELMG
jgi:hypothetical protein